MKYIYHHLVLVNIIQKHNGCWDDTSLKPVLTFIGSPPTNVGAAMLPSGVKGRKEATAQKHSSPRN